MISRAQTDNYIFIHAVLRAYRYFPRIHVLILTYLFCVIIILRRSAVFVQRVFASSIRAYTMNNMHKFIFVRRRYYLRCLIQYRHSGDHYIADDDKSKRHKIILYSTRTYVISYSHHIPCCGLLFRSMRYYGRNDGRYEKLTPLSISIIMCPTVKNVLYASAYGQSQFVIYIHRPTTCWKSPSKVT